VLAYGISNPRTPADYRLRALEILHYFHGVNPFATVYLSNMYPYGATHSVNEIYHTWFWHGSKWSDALYSECGPAPGYVPGGPNAGAVKSGVPATLIPPAGQPPQKSYRDWNTPWPEASWALTEPGIYYQSSYVELLSKFVGEAAADPATAAIARRRSVAALCAASDGQSLKPAWVYRDGAFLWGGDWSFNAKIWYADKEGLPLTGRYDIKVTLTGAWGGFQPFARSLNFNLSPYAYLTFALKPTVANQTLKLTFARRADLPAGSAIDPLKYGPAPMVGQWSTYKIPLADAGVAGLRVMKFAIQDQTGLANNVFYLNDIGFLPADPPPTAPARH